MAEVKQDPEVTQLADAIVGEVTASDIENPDLALTPEQKAAKEKEDLASKAGTEGDGEPPVSERPPGEGEGEGEGGEKPGEGEQEDPLKDLDLRALLEHPVLGPKLQHWSDSGVAAQVQSALDRERPTVEATAQRTAAERQEDEHFSSMSPEEIHEEIARDEKQAAAYARFQQRKETVGQPDADGIARASQIYSYASRVASVSKVLEGSGLSDEVKAGLKPENFTHLGPEGIVAWGSAVFQAMVDHDSDQKVQGLLDEKWETFKEEKLAEMDSERPPTAVGRRAAGTPDLVGTDSTDLLEGALSTKPNKKE